MSDSTAEAGHTAGMPEDAKPPETVDQAIARLEREARAAKEAKDAADSAFAEVDGHLTALLNLQKDSDKAYQAYNAAYAQLKIDQQGFLDYYESERDQLRDLLGPKALELIDTKGEEKRAKDEAAEGAVMTAKNALTAAETTSADSEKDRKAKAAVVAGYKQLAATIGAGHTQLKALRDEAARARQAGQYALTYWLVVSRPQFQSVLVKTAAELIEPNKLPAALLEAVNKLFEADQVDEKNKKALEKCRGELKEAERRNTEQQTTGEAVLREELKQIPAAGAEQMRSNAHA